MFKKLIMKYKKYNFSWDNEESQKVFQSLVGFPDMKDSCKEVNAILACVKLKRGSKILDVGCGIGRHAIIFAQKGFKVIAMDVSHYYLKQAKYSARMKQTKIEFRQQNIFELQDVESYDFVFAYDYTLGSMSAKELKKQFRAMYLALKPNCIFFLKYAGPKLALRQKNSIKVEIVKNNYVIEEQKFIDNFRFEKCLLIDPKKKEIKEWQEKQRIFNRAEINMLLHNAGFKICNQCMFQKYLKKNIKNIFVCSKL